MDGRSIPSPAGPLQCESVSGAAGLWCPYRLPDSSMGEIAGVAQSDSEGSNSSIELDSAMVISGGGVKCRWHGCGHWFEHLDLLATHVTRVHATSGQGGLFYCGWEGCTRGDRGFNARYKMLVHVRTHTNEKPHHCFKCDKSFSRAENLKIHARSHTGERPYVCPVPGCGKAYSNSSDRFKHTRTHSVDKPYVCKVPGCPKRYTDPSSLRKHVKTYRHFPPTDDELIKLPTNETVSDEDDCFTDKKPATPIKTDCTESIKSSEEHQESKVSVSLPPPLPCSKPCCTGTKHNGIIPNPDIHLLWGHDVQYNLFRSWMDSDLGVLSRSLAWTNHLTFWNHPFLHSSTCSQQMSGITNQGWTPNSNLEGDAVKYSPLDIPSNDLDPQDLPLDLTIHRAGTRV
ncbi:hypothetical protein L9F63_005915 [Diploptera punctata]|uniref:C2H2-type domain-containing protein n=1 Tax=Diploptera punctata TaxID=6984 RepID=A0AAD8E5Q4_DIPPU|nr:hypothetical protein L9F63_005915 [Diploptera punctata]